MAEKEKISIVFSDFDNNDDGHIELSTPLKIDETYESEEIFRQALGKHDLVKDYFNSKNIDIDNISLATDYPNFIVRVKEVSSVGSEIRGAYYQYDFVRKDWDLMLIGQHSHTNKLFLDELGNSVYEVIESNMNKELFPTLVYNSEPGKGEYEIAWREIPNMEKELPELPEIQPGQYRYLTQQEDGELIWENNLLPNQTFQFETIKVNPSTLINGEVVFDIDKINNEDRLMVFESGIANGNPNYYFNESNKLVLQISDTWIDEDREIQITAFMIRVLGGLASNDIRLINYYSRDKIDSLLKGKADWNHTHPEYSKKGHNHDGEYSEIGHTHSQYITLSNMISYMGRLHNLSDTAIEDLIKDILDEDFITEMQIFMTNADRRITAIETELEDGIDSEKVKYVDQGKATSLETMIRNIMNTLENLDFKIEADLDNMDVSDVKLNTDLIAKESFGGIHKGDVFLKDTDDTPGDTLDVILSTLFNKARVKPYLDVKFGSGEGNTIKLMDEGYITIPIVVDLVGDTKWTSLHILIGNEELLLLDEQDLEELDGRFSGDVGLTYQFGDIKDIKIYGTHHDYEVPRNTFHNRTEDVDGLVICEKPLIIRTYNNDVLIEDSIVRKKTSNRFSHKYIFTGGDKITIETSSLTPVRSIFYVEQGMEMLEFFTESTSLDNRNTYTLELFTSLENSSMTLIIGGDTDE